MLSVALQTLFIYFKEESFPQEVNAQRTLRFLPPSQCLPADSRSLEEELARFSRKLLGSV